MSMSITNASASTAAANAAAASAQSPSTTGSGSELVANKETFLKLLVAQLKNQDPLKPMDGMEFVGQLSQFTQVEQLMGIREDLAKAAAELKATTPADSSTVTP